MNNIKNKPFVSIIVCSYNGEKNINRCLHSLMQQNYSKNNYEVVVVNDGSTDKTRKITENYKINIINNKKNLGLAQSRNIGIEHSKGEIITFTDDDCIADKNWIKNLTQEYKNNNIIAVGGSIIPANNEDTIIAHYLKSNNPLKPLETTLLKSNNIIYRFYLYLNTLFKLKTAKETKRQVYALAGANMSFRKKIFTDFKFDKNFTFGAEEEDLFKRIYKNNQSLKVIYTPQAKIFHNFDLKLNKILKRNFMYGQGNARMYFKHADHNLTIYPFPLIYFLALLFVNKFNWIIFLPNFLYFHWTLQFFTLKKARYLLFPYIQLATELSANLGILKYIISKKYK